MIYCAFVVYGGLLLFGVVNFLLVFWVGCFVLIFVWYLLF